MKGVLQMKLIKFKSIASMVMSIMILSSIPAMAADTNPEDFLGNITVTLNGIELDFNVDPYLNEDSRTMVEVYGIVEALDSEINWEADTQAITIVKDDKEIIFQIGEKNYTINGEAQVMDTEPVIVDSRTIIPVRFISEALDQTVAWDNVKQVVELTNEDKAVYTILTTGQSNSYDEDGQVISTSEGDSLYGQDADYASAEFSFTLNGDGTTTDNNTGLTWETIPLSGHLAYSEAIEYANNLELGGYDDWRLPTNKELFNISDFSTGWPFLDRYYFEFPDDNTADTVDQSVGGAGGPQGDSSTETQEIPGADKAAGSSLLGAEAEDSEMMPPPPAESTEEDSVSKSEGQFWTDYYNAGTTHGGAASAFGVNQATGHIKAYPAETPGDMGKYVRAVRGDENASINDFVDNGDGTITDEATDLMWMQADSSMGMEWEDALVYAENFSYGGYDDWRLPDVKELQSIVDYSGVYPAIDHNYFTTTALEENEFYYFWTNTSAYFSTELPEYGYAWYVAFGYAVNNEGEDTHGAGAVRFSPKYAGSESVGEGGDNITNSVRLVRNITE